MRNSTTAAFRHSAHIIERLETRASETKSSMNQASISAEFCLQVLKTCSNIQSFTVAMKEK